ncbi:MAG: metallophosphoesterase [Sneathiella sp.]
MKKFAAGIVSASVLLFALVSKPGFAMDTLGPSPSAAPDGALMAVWTQITGTNTKSELTGFARMIVAGTGGQPTCDQFSIKTSNATLPSVFTARTNVAPTYFPVTVCEAEMYASWEEAILLENGSGVTLWSPVASVKGAVASFPTLHSVGRKNAGTVNMVSMGDSGCRDKGSQACDTPASWPFAELADAAIKNVPDFILHVGDYRYSHKKENDFWEYWYEEFFYPAQDLLLAAPWVLVRGNHEACGYEDTDGLPSPWGTGWFYFLEHTASAKSTNCLSGNPSQHEPWYFDVGVQTPAGATDDHRFIVMDSSTVDVTRRQTDDFLKMLQLSDDTKSVWWAGHRPIWGLEVNLEESLMNALAQYGGTSTCWVSAGLPCSLKTMIGGHIHNLERLQFFGAGVNAKKWLRPQQYVNGNSGVELSPALNSSPCNFTISQSSPSVSGPSLVATVDWVRQFGYTLWQRSTKELSGWKETRYFFDGTGVNKVAPTQLDGRQSYITCQLKLGN